jgi:hypothetical protein
MANQYYYDIIYLDTVTTPNGLEKSVACIHWHLVGTHDDGTVVRYANETVINPEPSDQADFVTFEDLTAENVLPWLHSNITEEETASYRSTVDSLIEQTRNVNEVATRDIPWSE